MRACLPRQEVLDQEWERYYALLNSLLFNTMLDRLLCLQALDLSVYG
jgi:hypothetical protein